MLPKAKALYGLRRWSAGDGHSTPKRTVNWIHAERSRESAVVRMAQMALPGGLAELDFLGRGRLEYEWTPRQPPQIKGYKTFCSSLVRLSLCLHGLGWCLELGPWRASKRSLLSTFCLGMKGVSVVFFPFCCTSFKCPLLIAWELGLSKCIKMHIQFAAGVCLWNISRGDLCGKMSIDGLHWRRRLGFSEPNPWACEGACNRILR